MRAESSFAVLEKFKAADMGPIGVDSSPSSCEWAPVVSGGKIPLLNFSPTSSLSSLEEVLGGGGSISFDKGKTSVSYEMEGNARVLWI